MIPSGIGFLSRESFRFSLYMIPIILVLFAFSSCAPVDGKIAPPETNIERLSDKYGKNGISVKVSGKDDKTLPEKLIYSYKLFSTADLSTPLLEATTTSADIKIESDKVKKEGSYKIKVSAVNEYGLSDETPAEGIFTVDYTPPGVPFAEVNIEAGELIVRLDFSERQKDLAGFKFCLIFPDGKKQYFESISREFVHDVKKGERFDFEAIAIDDVYNESIPVLIKIDASANTPPSLAKKFSFPKHIGLNDEEIAIDYFDDWDDLNGITVEATLCGDKIIFKNKVASIDPSTLVEGEGVFELRLTDKDKASRVYSEKLNVDLTPPVSPSKPELGNMDGLWVITWSGVDGVQKYEIYASNDGEQWLKIGESIYESFNFSDRFLQYAVKSIDSAGNESKLSFPVRSYDEKYKPQIENELLYVEENIILTKIYSPYIVKSEIVIPKDKILAVENGVEILFEETGKLIVNGQFIIMPSTDKNNVTSVRCFDCSTDDPVFLITGGTAWIEDTKILMDDCKRPFLMAVNDSVLNMRRVDAIVKGDFLQLQNSECVSISHSYINSKKVVKGGNVNKLKIDTTEINCESGIDITQGREIYISDLKMVCSDDAFVIGELTNLQIINSRIDAANVLSAYKFSTAEIYNSTIHASDTAIKAKEASTVNIRKSDIFSNLNGISVYKNSYVSFIEGSISNCSKAIGLEQSDIFLSNVRVKNNEIGLYIGKNSNIEKEEVIFEGNGEDITENL